MLTFLKAHIKSALVGASVTIPIKDGKLVSTIFLLACIASNVHVGNRYVARNLVSRVPCDEAPATDYGYYPG